MILPWEVGTQVDARFATCKIDDEEGSLSGQSLIKGEGVITAVRDIMG